MKLIKVFCLLLLPVAIYSQSLNRPIIYSTSNERTAVLDKINHNSWAKSLVESMKSNVDPKITAHSKNKESIFSAILTIPANDGNSESYASPYASAHGKVLTSAEYSAILYYITQDEKYASFAADILAYYFDVLSKRTESTTTITGNYFYDSRTSYNHLAVAYDFVYKYLKKPNQTVYSTTKKAEVSYDHLKAQKVIRNIAARSLNESGGLDVQGKIVSNHPVLTAPGSLFSILCVDDDIERERLFNLFWNRGTKRQNSFTKTILKMFTDQALWPESVSYGFMPNVQLILNLVDKIKPSLNVGANNIKLFESAALLENLRLPNRYFVRYGDSHRKLDGTGNINRYALNFAKRRGYASLQNQTEIALKQSFPTTNGYNTSVPAAGFDNYNAIQLFWGETLPNTAVSPFDYKTTVIIKHAGVALQRNVSSVNPKDNGLVGIIGGAHYVHAHLTGITMELYGSGDVMGPNGGLPPSLAERQKMPFQGYLNRYAGNNTVITNGSSHGTSFPGAWGNDKFLYQDTTKNIASEPAHLEKPISKYFSFATQYLDDNVNNCDQQRTLSIIRTSPTTGYYFDLFRSKSNKTNNFHDYIYHNIGDATQLKNDKNQVISVTSTNKYQNDIGDSYKSPGWRSFEETKSTAKIADPVKIRFDLNQTQRYMHMLMPAGIAREYTKAIGPATYEALNGYESKKTQIIAVRQQGEAWDRPYVAVFEPSKNATSSVQSVDHLYVGTKVVGAKVVSDVDGNVITDYIISNPESNSSFTLASPSIEFTGRFAVVRVESDSVTLYIGQGEKLSFNSVELLANANNKGVKIIQTGSTPPQGNLPPVVSLTAPSNDSQYNVGDSIILTATASDADGSVAKVNFKIDDEFYKTVSKTPYKSIFVPEKPGTYKISALAFDNANAKSESFVTIKVNAVIQKEYPKVTIDSPTDNDLVNINDTLLIVASASDSDGSITKVNFKINDAYYKSVTSPPYQVEFIPKSEGVYKLSARAYDNDSLQTEIDLSITVVSPSDPPVVQIISPAENASIILGDSILLKASVPSGQGPIEKINFKVNDEYFKTVKSEPYEVFFKPESAGVYKLSARAYGVDELYTEVFVEVNVINSSSSSSSLQSISSSSSSGAVTTIVQSSDVKNRNNDITINYSSSAIDFHVYPNRDCVVELYDYSGRIQDSFVIGKQITKYEMNHLKKGFYIVQVKMNGKIIQQKVIMHTSF